MSKKIDRAVASDVSSYLSVILGGVGTVAGGLIEFTMAPAAGVLASTLGVAGALTGLRLTKGIPIEKLLELQSSGYLPRFSNRIWKSIAGQVKRKLDLDLDVTGEILTSQENLEKATADARNKMLLAGVVCMESGIVADPRMPKTAFGPRTPSALSWKGSTTPSDLHILAEASPITVSCTAPAAAVIASLRSINSEFGKSFGVDIQVSSEYIWGPDQLKEISSNDVFDFVVAVDAPFFMAGKSRALRYRHLFPLYWDANFSVRRAVPAPKITQQVLFCPDSSAKEAYEVAQHQFAGMEAKEVDFSALRDVIDRLDTGQAIISWDPIATSLAEHPDLEKEFGTEYRAYRSLYCHRRLRRKSRVLGAFVNVLVSELNRLRSNRELALEYLVEDQRYLLYFAASALNDRLPDSGESTVASNYKASN